MLYASILTLLGAWGAYTMSKVYKPGRFRSWKRRLILLEDLLFTASCLGCAAALWTGHFRAWMAASVGLSYLLMIPLPCYFEPVNRIRWLHAARNLLFAAVALALFAVAAGIIPLSLLGLS